MNSAPLNSVEINGAPDDALQRSATFIDAAAQVTLGPRVWARGLIGSTWTPTASVTETARTFARSIVNIAAAAEITTNIRRYTTSPVTVSVWADMLVSGAVEDRTLVRAPVTIDVGAIADFDASVLARSPLTMQPEASVGVAATSFARVRSAENWSAQASIWLQFDILKRIPYDEDSVPERTIVMSEDPRVVYVS